MCIEASGGLEQLKIAQDRPEASRPLWLTQGPGFLLLFVTVTRLPTYP